MVFGFGSFFRGEKFKDIDVLFVVEYSDGHLLKTAQAIRAHFHVFSENIGVKIDPLILTKQEYAERPLRNMSQLKPL